MPIQQDRGCQVEFELADHDVSMRRLDKTMQRVGATVTPSDFVERVAMVFKQAQARGPSSDLVDKFLAAPSHGFFVKAVQAALGQSKPSVNVLALGCGETYAGQAPHYALQVVRELNSSLIRGLGAIEVTRDLKHEHASTASQSLKTAYDIVVAHSLFHFVPELRKTIEFVDHLVAPGGCLVLAHEPNAAYWRNEHCQQQASEAWRAVSGANQRSFLRRFRRGLSRVKSKFTTSRRGTIREQVNVKLRKDLSLTGDLTDEEISRIVDPHRPTIPRGEFRIGLDGFEARQLRSVYLHNYELVWLRTYGHLGYVETSCLDAKWKKIELDLASQYPEDGVFFSACWKKLPPTS